MKQLALVIIASCLSMALLAGEITKTYTFSDLSIETADQFQLVHFENCLNTGYTGAPSLPWYAVKLLLPPGEKAVSYSVIFDGETLISGEYTLYPQQASRPLSHGPGGEFQINEELYRSNVPYPKEPFGIMTTEYMNGHAIAMLNICPLVYIPSEGKLSYYSEATVQIITESSKDSEQAFSMHTSNKKIIDRIERFVQNPGMLSSYPVRKTLTNDYQLLIITPQAYESQFDDLSNLYLYRGLKSEIATTEEIAGSMTGQDLQEQIRNYIIQEVQNNNVEFVLLGGDVEFIPHRGFYCYVQSGAGYSDTDIPADLYYSGLDGTWNDNGDNLWAEIGEDDLLPDVAVGRLSFSNFTELSAMLNKTTTYQDNPILGELTYPLLAGEHLWSSPETWGSDYINLVVGYHDDNGYTTIGIPPEHNLDSLYEKDQSWGGSDIIAEINTGKSFVHHCGHANSSTVMHLSTSDITNSNFSQVNGITHNYTFVMSHGCICGAFDNSDCIMEYMVKIENFAAAVIGNSRYGWFNEGQTEGPSAHLHREMVDALYEEQMGRIGAAFVECKIQTAPWVNAPGQHEEGALRWNFYDINILGDPTLQIWTDEPFTPTATYNSPIMMGDTVLSLTAYNDGMPAEGLSCTLIKDGVLHGVAVTDINGEASISIDPLISSTGLAELTVSGYNCLATSFNVVISPASGPLIIYHDHQLDDTIGGNANGVADFGETIMLTVSLANAGATDASNVEAILSNGDQYLTVTDNFGDYGTIVAGTASAPINEFSFDIDDFVPDQHVVELSMDITGTSKENWSASFNITLNAPMLEAGTLTIDDDIGGNGDGFLDPGETANLSIGVLNTGHSDAPAAIATLSTSNTWVILNNTTVELGTLETGMNYYATFEVSIDEEAPLGTVTEFMFTASSGEYVVSENYASTIGILVEDWETGTFELFNWQFSGDAPWEICNIDPWEGDYCVRSGDIDDNQESELYVTFEVLADGDVSFYRKLSSEAEWDFLKFYIDYEMMGEWSGELDWEMVSYPVEAGLHKFRWVYDKDPYFSNGEDCAWVDFIVLPPVDIATNINNLIANENMNMNVWPNPARTILNIEYSLTTESNVSIVLYNLLGKEVTTLLDENNILAGKYSIQKDISAVQAGIYLCRIVTREGIFTRKLVIE